MELVDFHSFYIYPVTFLHGENQPAALLEDIFIQIKKLKFLLFSYGYIIYILFASLSTDTSANLSTPEASQKSTEDCVFSQTAAESQNLFIAPNAVKC